MSFFRMGIFVLAVSLGAQCFAGPIKPLVGSPRRDLTKSCIANLQPPAAIARAMRVLVEDAIKEFPENPKLEFKIQMGDFLTITVVDREGGKFKAELKLHISSPNTAFVTLDMGFVTYDGTKRAADYSDLALALDAILKKVFPNQSPQAISDAARALGLHYTLGESWKGSERHSFVNATVLKVEGFYETIVWHLRILQAWAEHLKELSQNKEAFYEGEIDFQGYEAPKK